MTVSARIVVFDMQRRDVVGLALLTGCLPNAALALPAPSGPVVLALTGRVERPNRGAAALFDMAMLAGFAQSTITTATPWFIGARRFTGPRLRDVLDAAGAQGSLLRASALNDYRVEIPFTDVRKFDVVLTRLIDDRPLPVRDKGPLFVMYPFSTHPELLTSVYYGRCIWQLKAIEVV